VKKEIYSQIQAIEQTHWWYVARRKIIFDWVFRTLADHPVVRLLDIGCGTGFNMEQVRARCDAQVVGLDLSTDALTFCQSRNLPDLVGGDSTRSPLRSASFDVIMALDLIEHLDDDQAALREFARLLRPGGALIVFAPAFNFLWGLQDDVSCARNWTRPGCVSLNSAMPTCSCFRLSGAGVQRCDFLDMMLESSARTTCTLVGVTACCKPSSPQRARCCGA
jgi:SAM-dependent methyltransferase